MTVIHIMLAIVLAVFVIGRLLLHFCGKEDVRVGIDAPFTVEEKTADHIVLSKPLFFHNEGTSCATLMDAIVRPQLPYEQYAGLAVRSKAECEGKAREDDYFEAVIVQKKGDAHDEDKLTVYAKIELRPRGGRTLADAVAHAVDFGIDFIWLETGRMPCHYRKVRLELTADELARLAGVTLAKD